MLLNAGICVGEGTKEIMQNPAHNGRIILDPTFGGFGMFGAQPEDRLHIRILEPGEKIYYGLGQSIKSTGQLQEVANDVVFRIVDPTGIVVSSEKLQPLSGEGFIGSYGEAVAGPQPFSASGYEPLVLTAYKAGDYYIEFDFPTADSGGRREFDYFDITVVSSENVPTPGRVWSKAWMFTVSEQGLGPWENPFYGKLFILSEDHVVTSVDFNGMRPFVFTLFANGTGVANTGNPLQDRKSVPSKRTYPQYRVFLNDPDPIVFPSGSVGEFAAPTTITGNGPPYCIRVNTTKSGTVQVHIELNGLDGYQVNSRDLLIATGVEEGENCITWDGRDGKGELVDPCDGKIFFFVTFAGGLTHMPIYDVETNDNGFIVELVRPTQQVSHLALYWDDSNIEGYTVPPSEGCDGKLGCHKFPYFFGDSSTINTWWYAVSDIVDTAELFKERLIIDDLMVIDQSCSNRSDGSITVFPAGGMPSYQVALDGGNFQSDPQFSGLTNGNYTVRVRDADLCLREETVKVGLSTNIHANFDYIESGTYNQILFDFTGTGASTLLWDFGDGTNEMAASPIHRYNYDTTYLVKLIVESGPPDFCVDSILKAVEIYPEIALYIPNAFSPNGDNLNDTFQVIGISVHQYEIYIFGRDGTRIFHSDNLEDSWDGTRNGKILNPGVYVYLIRAFDRKGELREKKGTVMLVR